MDTHNLDIQKDIYKLNIERDYEKNDNPIYHDVADCVISRKQKSVRC